MYWNITPSPLEEGSCGGDMERGKRRKGKCERQGINGEEKG
jgi:hypothetical protein